MIFDQINVWIAELYAVFNPRSTPSKKYKFKCVSKQRFKHLKLEMLNLLML